MAKKTIKKVKKSKPKLKGYRGLKMYVVIGLLSLVAITGIVFFVAWNKNAENFYNPDVAVLKLPDSGDITYYTNCVIDNVDGVVGYADKSVQKCVYFGTTVDGYDYGTSLAYLKCISNDIYRMNVCSDGKLK